jgi:hypothetical protein
VLKQDSDESDIIVYDMHDDYSAGSSSKSKKSTDKSEKKDASVPDLENGVTGSTAHLGSLTGRVYDKLTYRTIEGACVTITKDLSIRTDERGVFLAAYVKPGKYRVTAFEEGYMVQSHKGTVVAGETTQLESFHLVPDCLAAEYPDAIEEEEEETLEEETAGPVMEEPLPSTSSEEIPATSAAVVGAKTGETKVEEPIPAELPDEPAAISPKVVRVEGIEKKIVPDAETDETITEEKPVGSSETDINEKALSVPEVTIEEEAGKDIIVASPEETHQTTVDGTVYTPVEEIQTPAMAADSIETVPFVSEETVVKNLSPIDEPAPVAVETGIVEAVPPVSEETVVEIVSPIDEPAPVHAQTGIAEAAAPEKTPKELSGEEAQPKSSWKTWLKKKLKKEVHEEEDPWSLVEFVPEIITQEVIVEETHKEEPLLDIPPEETSIPVMASDAAETAISGPEKEIAEDTSSGDEFPGVLTVTDIVETIQFEEVSKEMPQEPVIGETPFETAIEEMAQDEIRDETRRGQIIELPLEAATEIAAQVMVVEEIHIETLVEPSFEIIPEITAQEEITERVHGKPVSEPSMEAISEITEEEMALGRANKEESFADVSTSDETVSISVDGIYTPVIAVDSTGAVISVFEKRILEDISSIDKLSPLPVETDMTETAQSEMFSKSTIEQTPPELSLEETPIEFIEIEIAGENVREEAHKEKSLPPSTKEAAINFVPAAKYREPSIEPPVRTASDTAALEISQPQEFSEEALQEPPGEEQQLKLQWWKLRKRKQAQPEGLAVDTSAVKSQIPVVIAEPKATFTSSPEEKTVVSESSSAKEFSSAPEETVISPKPSQKTLFKSKQTAEDEQSSGPSVNDTVEQTGSLPKHPQQPLKSPPEAAPEAAAQKKTAGPTQEGEELIELAIEEIIKSNAADPALDEILTEINKQTASIHAPISFGGKEEHSKTVTAEEPLESADDAFASLSDEEKAAMLDDQDAVEVAGFVGIVNAQPNPAYKGLPVSIAYALKNLACDDLKDFILRITLTDPETGAIYETFETKVACIKGTFSMGGFVLYTSSYETSVYRLMMRIVSEKTKISHLLTDIPLEIKSIF